MLENAGGAQEHASLVCHTCAGRYRVEQGIPALIGDKSVLNLSEVETQDRVSGEYDGVRYQRASSVRYHDDTMAQLIELAPPHDTVLDAGCGTGAFLEFLRRTARWDGHYVGIDVSRGMLAHAARRLGVSSGGGSARVHLAQADACRLPFADDSFDVVYARALLHHLPDPIAGIREIRRVLKPGGVAAFLDPNKTVLSELPRRLAQRTEHFDDDHKNFRAAELESWVSDSLSVTAVRFFGYVAYPLLGFPDLVDFDRLRIGRLAAPLIRLDRLLGKLPLVRSFGWGVMIAARKGDARPR
jgi:ubiquinone/menaquinone biosynthesis C-methylase UbiE